MSAAAKPKTSKARLDANRRNALKSTGPRTAEGRHRVSQNAVTHGLTARHIVLDEESEEAFYTLRRKMLEDLNPGGEIECQLAEQMIVAQWRLTRIWETETDLYNKTLESIEEPDHRRARAFEQLSEGNNLQRLDRYEARLSREYDRCLRRLTELKAAREREREQARKEREQRPLIPIQHTDLMTADEYIRLQRKEKAPEQNKPNDPTQFGEPRSPNNTDPTQFGEPGD